MFFSFIMVREGNKLYFKEGRKEGKENGTNTKHFHYIRHLALL